MKRIDNISAQFKIVQTKAKEELEFLESNYTDILIRGNAPSSIPNIPSLIGLMNHFKSNADYYSIRQRIRKLKTAIESGKSVATIMKNYSFI